MNIDFYKIGLRQFPGHQHRKQIRKWYSATFFILSDSLKGVFRDVFRRLGLDADKVLDDANMEVSDIVRYIGVWTCKQLTS